MKMKCKCGKIATWLYTPSEHGWYCCDDCVPRGCFCNKIPIDGNWNNPDSKNWIQELDDKGRKLPCCEWLCFEEGIDDEKIS